ncbi:hypothetical protein [Acinetobacter sp.]|jgi:hypothetical protein|uniref:alpha/beta hydrolase family protein n=1 Tax=Acinetobacter sp. TaxID=472 RepID=UPI0028306E8E|nr:hypothetical protein [Acinetobacter sp.]MDR2249574.1 hypothetical protein [Acinetobacter sp.]
MTVYYKAITLLSLSISAFMLIGCNSKNKDNYTGPVQGEAVPIVSKGDEKTEKKEDVSINETVTTSGIFGADKRFSELSTGVTESAKYIASPATEYQFGSLVVNGKSDFYNAGQPTNNNVQDVRVVPLHGWIRYPQMNIKEPTKKFPIIVFLHGQHNAIDPSYKGYDYLAKNLAEQGYVVLSIDANDINGTGGDPSSQSRGQLVLGTLDKLMQLDSYGGPGVLNELRGKLDFDRLGIMGHSRGGQGINSAIKFNTQRFGNDIELFTKALIENPNQFSRYPELVAAAKEDKQKLQDLMIARNISFSKTSDSVKPYNFRAAFALAPTDFVNYKGLINVPFATLLPSCDGDVSDLQGTFAFDNNRFSMKYDMAPKYQILVRGANHNFFNTIWVDDDFIDLNDDFTVNYDNDDYCNSGRSESARLNAIDQRSTGQFLINSFMRYYVGDENQFKSYWNATAQLPKSACPKGDDTCDERVILTVQKNGSQVIQRYENYNALTVNLLGGLNEYNGFLNDSVIACRSYLGFKDTIQGKCSNNIAPLFTPGDTYKGGLVSFPDQLHLSWGKVNATYVLNLNKLPTQGFDSLTFRVALPKEIGQEIYVKLTDINGKVAQVAASDFSDALYSIPRKKKDGIPFTILAEDQKYDSKVVAALNMINIPLKAFKGIDVQYLNKLEFIFPKEKGTVVLNDIQLQSLRN